MTAALAGSLSTQSAVWYVDNTAKSGSNNGTSWANAWRGLKSIVWGSSGVKAGDTLYVSGGSSSKVYTDTWEIGASGTAGNPITIAVDASSPEHSGRVTFDYNGLGDNAKDGGIGCQRNYIVFNGNVDGERHIVISNLRNVSNGTGTAGIFAQGTTGVVIDSIESVNCNNPIWIQNSTGFIIRNCLLRDVRGDAAIRAAGSTGNFDASRIYNNRIETLVSNSGGPDGIQATSGVSVYGNRFLVSPTSIKTSDQHPDTLQVTGNYLKIYGNDFVNVGDSSIDYDSWANPNPNNVWIYNNTFRIVNAAQLDPYPEYIRFYTSASGVKSISNFKIFNNTFVDNDYWTSIGFYGYRGSPSGSGNEIKNNIFYNCGNGANLPIIRIDNSSAYTSSSWSLDANVYYHPKNAGYIVVRDTLYTILNWLSGQEPRSTTTAVKFVNYARYSANNDLHLAASDTGAADKGLALTSYASTDKDGTARPQGGAWDIGAFERGGGGSTPVNAAPTVSAIGTDATDVDGAAAGLQVYAATGASFTGSASDPDGDSLTWQWLYSVNGGTAVVHTSGSGSVATDSFTFSSAGASYTWILRFSDGKTSSESRLNLSVVAPPAEPPPPGEDLILQVESGNISGPFVVSGGSIVQRSASTLADGGRAVIPFTITEAGEYAILSLVNAPSEAENSFYLNIDGEPQDPRMVWHIPVTSGPEERFVSWQGSGTFENSEFSPRFFSLSAGSHQLIIRGREANTALDVVALRRRPAPPQGVRVVGTE